MLEVWGCFAAGDLWLQRECISRERHMRGEVWQSGSHGDSGCSCRSRRSCSRDRERDTQAAVLASRVGVEEADRSLEVALQDLREHRSSHAGQRVAQVGGSVLLLSEGTLAGTECTEEVPLLLDHSSAHVVLAGRMGERGYLVSTSQAQEGKRLTKSPGRSCRGPACARVPVCPVGSAPAAAPDREGPPSGASAS